MPKQFSSTNIYLLTLFLPGAGGVVNLAIQFILKFIFKPKCLICLKICEDVVLSLLQHIWEQKSDFLNIKPGSLHRKFDLKNTPERAGLI